ncbi:MAG TPA: polar amino acid ABC transporter permease [Hydrogenophaga sp.]|uniref:amino acid ABC transporter permease n=1 Tax=Hydrogenophaga sp. TaxID=1904254 RepID=UPI0008BCE32F|nr:amino acid ABC transporter permease [Hydrogenophaga sp.]OGA75151.1 MAG: polar amino acid ABC transporter permease [Burkholderiales bacterium GWE1_65_30]OGA93285.1 MAG: polar amino acid ABC transporter permease [Burkholderiales bacterium GWF1_66_17]HAX20891.1 polar amino acid ABC transporter permease [Hydrogenophaga sp.]HBU17385.1 polar amino acid ABC transporter permease [Hydrogenophaga sp.]
MRIEFDFIAVLLQWPLLAKGVLWTLGLTAISAVIGLLVGTLCAWARSSGPLWLRWVVGCYVELIRNTPFIVQLFFVFFGLPAAGVKLTPETASVIAMVVNLGAYAAEIIRAGIEATPKGQFEAAASLALSRLQTFRYVVLPPALQKVWPALTSQIIIVMLGSAVCGQISTEELSYAANLIQSRNFRAFEAFIIATGIYLLLSVGVRALLNWAGPRYLFGGRR